MCFNANVQNNYIRGIPIGCYTHLLDRNLFENEKNKIINNFHFLLLFTSSDSTYVGIIKAKMNNNFGVFTFILHENYYLFNHH